MPQLPRSLRPTRAKTLLALVLTIGGLTTITVSGTYATFLSEETNRSTISTGTLTLGNTVGATSCFTTDVGTSGNVNSGCAALMTAATLKFPDGTPLTGQVQIKDTGSIDGAHLYVYMPSCAMSTTAGATANGGDPCQPQFTSTTATGLWLTIEETNSGGTVTKCWYPVTATGACSAAAGYSTSAPNSFGTFAQNVKTSGAALDLGAGPVHDAIRYFKIGVSLPTNASNSLQGEQATFALTWRLTT